MSDCLLDCLNIEVTDDTIPFIIAARRYSKSDIFNQLRDRIERDSDTELHEALAQIGSITRLRVQAKVTA